MKITIRPANLSSDRHLLIDTMYRYLTRLSDTSRFDWLYLNNPYGQARAWIASRIDTGEVVGTAAAFPRLASINGSDRPCWVLGDFCIKHEYRTLGPALQLQRACLAEVDEGAVAFLYDFPSQGMTAIYRRLGVDPSDSMFRMAKPLRVDRFLRKFTKNPTAIRYMSTLGNRMLAFGGRTSLSNGQLTISFHKGDCNDEFSKLDVQLRSQYGVYIRRPAEYLNWRYVRNPLHSYRLMTVRHNDRLLAYAAFSCDEKNGFIVDIFGVQDNKIIAALLSAVVEHLRAAGMETVSAPVFGSNLWSSVLQRLGFRQRDAVPVFHYARNDFWVSAPPPRGPTWFLMNGDRDS